MDSEFNLGSAEGAELIIATPFYNVQAYAPYTASLVASLQLCWQAGIKAFYWQICGDSYVWHVRNSFAHKFLHETQAKYLIFIDSDHAWDVEGFANLLKAPVDVVGAAYPCKNNWDFWSVAHAFAPGSRTPMGNAELGLIHAHKVPTGMMKISRKAFETIEANEPDNFYLEDQGKIHGFFNHIVQDDRSYGEDISFCLRCERAGIDLWIEPKITIAHFGVEPHTGNYHNFLRRQPGGDLHGTVKVPPDSVKRLTGIYRGQTAYIVGRGPSIENLSLAQFGPGPVISLNQAIVKVEEMGLNNPVYSMQKDGVADGEVVPQSATLLVHSRESEGSFLGYSPRYVFDNPKDFDLTTTAPSVMSATAMAKMMGCDRVVYLCCDACTNGDKRTWTPKGNGDAEIAELNNADGYQHFKVPVESLLKDAGLDWEWRDIANA